MFKTTFQDVQAVASNRGMYNFNCIGMCTLPCIGTILLVCIHVVAICILNVF